MGNTNDQPGRLAGDRANSNPELDSDRCDALRRSIGARLLASSWDELRVVDTLLGRLELGRDRYGFLDLAKSRDWEREEAEEHLDAAVYRACRKLVEHDERVAAIDADETAPRPRVDPVLEGLRELRDSATYAPRETALSIDDIDDSHIDAFFDDSDSDAPRSL